MFEINQQYVPTNVKAETVANDKVYLCPIVANTKGETAVPAEPTGAKKDLLTEAIG